MSRKIVVVHEAPVDFVHAAELADRVFLESIEWLEEGYLDPNRQWVERDPNGERLTWKSIPRRARAIGIVARGHFDGAPGQPDAQAARRALLYVQKIIPNLDAILLIRDVDNQPERREGLKQARSQQARHVRVVIGAADPKRECWVLAGFEPADEAEGIALDCHRRDLAFDPCVDSHRLPAIPGHPMRDAKRIVHDLTRGDPKRERRCWAATSLSMLRERGRSNGLAEYLAEVESILTPLMDPARRPDGPRQGR